MVTGTQLLIIVLMEAAIGYLIGLIVVHRVKRKHLRELDEIRWMDKRKP